MFLYIHIGYAEVSGDLDLITDEQEYIVRNKNQTIEVRLRKRSAYPVTFCRRETDGSYVLGYGKPGGDYDREFLLIRISRSGELYMQRDAIITLPIFYSRGKQQLYVSNEYEAVLSHIIPDATVSLATLLRFMVPNQVMHKGTLIKEIDTVSEREVLRSDKTSTSVQRPPDRTWITSNDIAQSSIEDFPHVIRESFIRFSNSRLDGQQYAFDASGGLDSATLPYFLAQQFGVRPLLATVFYDGEEGDKQHKKIQEIVAFTNAESLSTTLDPDLDFPLARKITTDNFSPSYILETMYLEPFARIAKQLKRRNIMVVATGFGGDDIFENIVNKQDYLGFGEAERNRRQNEPLPPFSTPLFRQDYVYHVPIAFPFAYPLLPCASLDKVFNNIYIAQDIWPVSPFLTPSLYEYCQGMLPQYRANKNAMRALHAAYGFPDGIYNASQNEDFGSFFKRAMRSKPIANTIKRFAAQSRIAQLGYIDTTKLLSVYYAAQNDDPAASPWLFSLYCWLCLEIHLNHTPNFDILPGSLIAQ